MNRKRGLVALAVTGSVGVVAGVALPGDWAYRLSCCAALCAFIFAALAAASTRDAPIEPSGITGRLVIWLAIGTDRPNANIRDVEALVLFFGFLSLLVGLAVGAVGRFAV